MARYIEIAGRMFPAVGVVCPQVEGEPFLDDVSRSMGVLAGDDAVYIPHENGLLVEVVATGDPKGSTYQIQTYAAVCEPDPFGHHSEGPLLYLPMMVCLDVEARRLVPWGRTPVDRYPARRGSWPGVWYWQGAEPDWAAEHIARLATYPLDLPPGPRVTLVDPDEFLARLDNTHTP